MPDDIDETTTDAASADETATNATPVDDASSSADSAPEEIDDSPEGVAAREKAERHAKRLASADAAEARKEKERGKKRQDFEAAEREERVASRERQAQETMRRAQSLIDELEQKKQQVLKGGPAGLRALGVEYNDWTKHELEETGPDAVGRKALERAEAVEAELRRRDARDAEVAAKQRQARAVSDFIAFADDNAEDFPHAADLSPRAFKAIADEVAAEYMQEFGQAPSFKALLPRLDKRAKEDQDDSKKRGAKRARPGTTPSHGAPNTQAVPPGQSASTPAHRTLTPAQATTRATAPRAMTPEEEEEWALNELRQAMKADAKLAAG